MRSRGLGAVVSKMILRQVAGKIATTSFLTAEEFLAAVYEAAKGAIDGYSYVRYTEDLGFGACNAMYLIIHGTRPLTLKGAQKIVQALDLTGTDRKYFLELVKAQRVADPSARDAAFERLVELKAKALPTTLDKRQLEFYNQWFNAAILELLSLEGASDDPEWIAARLMPAVPPKTVEKSLTLLKKLGHLVQDKRKGRLVPSNEVVSTGNEVFGLAVLRYHQQMIALAKDAVTDVAPMERDISAVTIAVPAAKLDELKEKIQRFRKELLEFSVSSQGADEIAQVNIQLFPIGRLAPRSRRNGK